MQFKWRRIAMNLSVRQSQRPRRAIVDDNKISCVSLNCPSGYDSAVTWIFVVFVLTNNLNRYLYNFFSIKKGGSLLILSKISHISILYFPQTRVFILTSEGLRSGSTPVLLTWRAFFPSFCFWQDQSGASNRWSQKTPTITLFGLLCMLPIFYLLKVDIDVSISIVLCIELMGWLGPKPQ